MDELLTVKQVAQLMRCSERAVQLAISEGRLLSEPHEAPRNNRVQYMIPLRTLPADLQLRYLEQQKPKDLPEPEPVAPRKRAKAPAQEPERRRAFDEFSAEEREQIALWTQIVKGWQEYRAGYERQTDADKLFVDAMKKQYPDLDISVSILYRRWQAVKAGDLEGLVDRRGGWNRGQTTVPTTLWNAFVGFFLDERCLPVTQCYQLTQEWARIFEPDAVVPHEKAFRRLAGKLEQAVVTMGRKGMKTYEERCAPYITRLYDDLNANDYWVADNHTLDIISQRDDGSEVQHRLSLTAFIDARSGVMVGWNLTDTPCSQSTLLALRHAINRFGIPRHIYVDNGLEFLCHDIGGKGHRSRKNKDLMSSPPPIFTRLGIEMTNAIVRNAKAKPIERTFGTLKNIVSRVCETFTGGNVLEKPESLKATLKRGDVPLDSSIRRFVGDAIDGIYNVGLYGGPVKRDKGKTRIEVWNESIQNVGMRTATEDDLALMLMRSSRLQKVGRRGVYITVSGERLEYDSEELIWMRGKDVYVRYDPANLASVRLYEAETDKYLCSVPMALETTLFFASPGEEVAIAQEQIRRVKKAVKGKLKDYISQLPTDRQIDMFDLQKRRAELGKVGMVIQPPKVIIPVRANEEKERLQQAVGDATGVVIDMQRMNRNAEERRKRT